MNNKYTKIWAAIVLVVTLAAAPAFAKNGLDLGLAGIGARPMGMGQAYTAVSDDVNAVFFNPAGLGSQKKWGMTTMLTRLLGRVEYKMAGGTYPTEYGTIGVGYLSALTPAGYLTTDKGSLATASAISYGSSLLILSYGKDLSEAIAGTDALGKLSIGVSTKLINNQFEGTAGSGSGSSTDIGLIYRPTANLSGGLTYQNVGGAVNWQNGTREKIPSTVKVGGALKLSQALVAADLEYGSQGSLLHGGVEYRPHELLVLRGGVDQTRTASTATVLNLTAGVGLKLAGCSFDYAYHQDSGLAENSTHYFSVSFQPEVRGAKAAVSKKIAAGKSNLQPTVGVDGVYPASTSRQAQEKDILSYYE